MLEVRIIEDGQTRVVPLPARKVSVGRRADNDIVLKDQGASRYHCTLEPVDGGCLVTDLDSHNGTKVNGRPVKTAIVTSEDEIRIGATALRVADAEADEFTVLDELADAEIAAETEPIPLAVVDEQEPEASERGARTSAAHLDLRNLRKAGRDVGFHEGEISMLDRQGRVVHAAGRKTSEPGAVRAMRSVLIGAFRTRATDMHFEPRRDDYHVRFRVDGAMVPMLTLPMQLGQSILGIIKVLCEVDVARRNVVQEGGFSVRVPGRAVDYRVSFSPTTFGQKLVIRVLDTANAPTTLHELGMPGVMLKMLKAACQTDAGMVLVSGPTGSGKTTTLYTALRSIDASARNVITIEDPVEYRLEGVTQTAVDTRAGMTFAGLLTSMLRQDPDVIFVGEIRDTETAQTAMRAAMTGHLVFSTLHARDTVGSIFRLRDLGVEPYLIANAVTVCLSQRLVRVLCERCRKPFRPSPSQLVRMGMENRRIDRIYTHVGCEQCMGTGFFGRTAIFEMLSFNDDLRDAILTQPTIQQIRKAADQWTFQTLMDSGFAKVAEGVTTIEEVERVAVQE